MKYIADPTNRFRKRPFFEEGELDIECEKIITNFLKGLYGEARFPVSTDDLTKLIEKDAEDLDLYADLSAHGDDVEGLTEFSLGRKPKVSISANLSDPSRENRLRTTLTHEFGHVRFHAYLYELETINGDLFAPVLSKQVQVCKRETILDAPNRDWMEWQAGYVCGALLMPATRVRQSVQEYRGSEKIAGDICYGTPQAQQLISAITKGYQVSEDAARVRLLKLSHLVAGGTNSSFFK